MEILVSSGRLCNRAVALAQGLRLLDYVPPGAFPAHYVNDSFPAGGPLRLLPPQLQQMDINGIEVGDWVRTYWDQDFGLATAAGIAGPGGTCLVYSLTGQQVAFPT